MFLTIAHYTITAGNERSVLELVSELEAASREEEGCISFDAYLKTGDSQQLVLLERYESAADFETHRASPHFERLVLGQIVPLLAARTVESFTLLEA
ncbi:antibiotic biosynthesis monooxygenase family protein [Frigoribacterium sp. UYMn621]|uniref:putative quinol monooxygenase n=1 Tax=Frigoribacterium sp. UYMn621 TaxID=3156343 RepID=UPI0033908426